MSTQPLTHDDTAWAPAHTLPRGVRVRVLSHYRWGGVDTHGLRGRIEAVYPGAAIARDDDLIRVRFDDGRLVPFWPAELEVVPC